MSDTERGFYTSSSEYSYKRVTPPSSQARISFNKPSGQSADKWFEEVERRISVRGKVEDSYDYIKVEFNSSKPIVIGVTGDWHLGATIDTEMLKRDVEVMAEHPQVSGIFFTGDLTDSANFNPAQDESFLNFEEQRDWLMSILNYVGDERILGFWKGNHDHKWERKHGTSKYTDISRRFTAPVFYGNSFVDLFVNDVNYRLMGSHRLRGNSIYNNAHPAIRGHREVQGLDLTFAGHVHKKGHIEQPVREFGDSRTIYGLINGTYQLGSEYTKDSGYGIQRGSELGMYWVVFGHDQKRINIMDTEDFIYYADRYL